ncbi:uncharacterized protein LOC129761263 [Toxorhynchites rutilus septentrionalis]|uniref:uncharacterized protein LOC129761263 n=1 Tax=Toxorhynchites rutilus septentrionalis TaxID=329112 RepID=UPI00247AEE59|nr:uncharacterized protein LOC129761263 [Toxorhynchites rutilus septentrionalis]
MAVSHSKIPVDIRKLIVDLRNEGKSLSEIADVVNRPRSSVQYVLQNFKKTNSLETTPGRGRKPKLTDRHHRILLREIKQNPKLSAPKLAASLSQNANIKKPFISAKNKKKRLEYAQKYVVKPEEFWKYLIFTDESKFNIFGSDGQVRVWRKPNTELESKNLRPTVKHGGGHVMSPDLNPIENLWDHLERKIREHQIQNKNQLKERVPTIIDGSDYLVINTDGASLR